MKPEKLYKIINGKGFVMGTFYTKELAKQIIDGLKKTNPDYKIIKEA